MLRHVALFEFRYQVRSPVFWVGSLLFFLLTFGSVVVDTIRIGGRGNVHVNSPFAILQTLTTMDVFAVFIVVAMVANVVIRDDETGFAPILRATRLGKRDYLVGRFVGATAAALLIAATIPLAIAVGSLMPWIDPEKLGAFRPWDYVYALLCFGLPTLLITAALFFSAATLTRSLMWTYVTAVGMLVLYFVMLGLLRDPRHDALVGLADPFALATLQLATKYWTASERNTLLPPLSGVLLANRLLWAGIALAVFALTYLRFRFEMPAGHAGRARVAREDEAPDPRPAATLALASPRSDRATRLRQLWALVRLDVGFVVRSPAFFVLLGIGLLNSFGALWYSGEWYGSPSLPVTRLMVEGLTGSFTLIPIIIAVYYAGELVWRDRDRRMHEIVDATAAPDWVHLVPKIVAIVLVLSAVSLVGVLGGVAVQLLKGYTQLELGAYLLGFVVPITLYAVHVAVLAVLAQVLVPQKFLGWGVMLLYIVAQVAAAGAGFEHALYNYGDAPPVPLSDMNGLGRFWIGRAWFQAYWSAVALVLATVAYLLWRRGTTTSLTARVAAARWRLRGGAAALLGGGLAAAVGIGAYCFYNTNVLNTYRTQPDEERLRADYERELLPYEKVVQPRIVAVTLDVQLYPRATRAETRGQYVIENRSAEPISDLHLRWHARLRLERVELDGASLARDYPRYHYAIYHLDRPLQPGERRVLGFASVLEERGFPNRRALTRIVENGTFLDNDEIAPRLGMSRDGLLTDRGKRRKYGLPPDLRPAKLEDDAARGANALRNDSDWVTADIRITTDADQIPIAPGYVADERVQDGRRSVRFRTEAPINHFFSIQSARYAIARDRFGAVDLAVYFQPGHERNVPRMLAAMKASLALCNREFSPYQFRQARILEFPGYADFAQSFANTIPYSENLGFISNWQDPTRIDVVSYVTAHEIAHQWWGHQLVSADQQGATMLIESFAQYSALLVMEEMYGRDQVRRFLKYELDRYLRSRGGEVVEELPLARVENQPYIHYQKGTLAMYWLKEVVGQPVLDRALRRLLARYAFRPAPYPNPRDFLAILREESGPEHEALIADLFERITLLDLKADHVASVRRADGRYDVRFEIEAHKRYADGLGHETEAPMDEEVDIGAFTERPGEKAFGSGAVLYFGRQRVHDGRQTVTLVLDREPGWVGVDPYNKRIDRNSDDNLSPVGG
jgi:aminopeptidase N